MCRRLGAALLAAQHDGPRTKLSHQLAGMEQLSQPLSAARVRGSSVLGSSNKASKGWCWGQVQQQWQSLAATGWPRVAGAKQGCRAACRLCGTCDHLSLQNAPRNNRGVKRIGWSNFHHSKCSCSLRPKHQVPGHNSPCTHHLGCSSLTFWQLFGCCAKQTACAFCGRSQVVKSKYLRKQSSQTSLPGLGSSCTWPNSSSLRRGLCCLSCCSHMQSSSSQETVLQKGILM